MCLLGRTLDGLFTNNVQFSVGYFGQSVPDHTPASITLTCVNSEASSVIIMLLMLAHVSTEEARYVVPLKYVMNGACHNILVIILLNKWIYMASKSKNVIP